MFDRKEKQIFLLIAADMHYLAADLFDDGEAFQKMMKVNVAKYTEGSQQIMDAFVKKAIEERPDAVLIPGDLTYSGELQSLKEMAEYLAKIKDAGIPVYVIDGNHDIEYGTAAIYHGSEMTPAETFSADTFMEMMSEFGYGQALYRDAKTLSYCAALKDDVWLLCLDVNQREQKGTLPKDTLTWAETVLQEAQKNNITVITMTHQNLLQHNIGMGKGFVIDNSEEVLALLKKYGVYLNISGHDHVQHISTSDGFTDICTESLTIWPLQYRTVTVDLDEKTYSTDAKHLDILQEESRQRFDETVVDMILKRGNQKELSKEENKAMLDIACELFACMFSGQDMDRDMISHNEGWKLWQKYAKDSFVFQLLKQELDK